MRKPLQAVTLALFVSLPMSVSCRSAPAQSRPHESKTDSVTPTRSAGQPSSQTDKSREGDASSESQLTVLANKIWKARVDRDCTTVAQHLDPTEYVSETPKERLEICEKDPFRYEKFRIGKVEVEGQFGWVHVQYDSKFAPYQAEPAQEVQTVEKWRHLNGQWYPVAARIYETCPESPSSRNAAEEKRLRERFEATWKHRLARDWKSLYELADPKDRESVPESNYAESESLIEYYEHVLEWVQVIGDKGEIRVTYANKLADPNMSKLKPRKINLSEHWILRNGEWYRDLLRTN